MATAKAKPNSSRLSGPSYHQIESGKLADAIYRNNTTFRKQLEAELQKLEIDTVKAQRNLEQNQIAFRNKIRLKQQQWLKKQEKQQDKLYHYVYTKRDDESPTNNAKNVKSQSRTSTVFTSEFDDDYDDHFADFDDNFSLEDIEDDNKKPILLLMNKGNKKAQPKQQQQANNIDRFGDVIKAPNHNNVVKSPALFKEKTSIFELSTPIQEFNSKRTGTVLFGNNNTNASNNKLNSNITPVKTKIVNNDSRLSQRSNDTNRPILFRPPAANILQNKSSSVLGSSNDIRKINLNKPEKNTLITARLSQLSDNKPNSLNFNARNYKAFENNATQSTMSFQSANKKADEPIIKQSMSRSQTKFFNNDEKTTPDRNDNTKKLSNFTASTSSFNKLPTFIKEYKININRNSKLSNKEFEINENKDPFVKSFEFIGSKPFKSSIPSIYNKNNQQQQQQQQQFQQQKQDVTFKLPSAVINKQKFENRIKSTFFKNAYQLQNQHEQEQLQEQQKTLKTQILNDERFLNLVSTLGTV